MNSPPPTLVDLPAGVFRYAADLSAPHDEMRGADGEVRPAWRGFLAALDRLGLPEMTRRWDEARQLIREHGVTYNVYGDPRGVGRPWALDSIPLLLSSADYAGLESGLVQRARLLEAILDDLYGPQRLLLDGLLPPELVFEHPGFLRPCHGARPAGGRRLVLYAANLGRSQEGRFWVLGDRTQAPSGAGYALENRLVLSRVLPDVFRDCQVERLAQFFHTLRETVRAIAPDHRDNPRIVLLTPGPYNETYFEHAFLAQYLGYALVEGGDLTVRGDRVYLKMLGGLQPVDVILRRMDDDYCDPLELRGDSFLGVPGLVQAARAGHVALANSLGSGLVETPALLAFLPALCRRLLGEELRMPSVPTWWCGDAKSRDHVLANLRRFVVKPTLPPSGAAVASGGGLEWGGEPVFGERLSREELQELADRIRARPRDFVGQELLALSTTPVLADGRLQPRRFLFRSFLTATKDSFAAMPGGLTRTAAAGDPLVVSMQQGGGSKDAWVLSDGPVSHFSLLPSSARPVELSRAGGDLPSRTADNLFWLGRYVERAEGCVRLLRGILVRLTEKAGLAEALELPALLRALTHQGATYPGFVGEGADARLAFPEPELRSLIFDPARTGALHGTLTAVRRIARMVRDRISPDTWRTLNRLKIDGAAGAGSVGSPGQTGTLSDVLDLLEQLLVALTAFSGLATESTTRGQGWRFLELGRRLERSVHTISLIRSTLTTAGGNEGPLLEAVLEVADSSMTYRRRYLGSLQTAPVLDLLVADETNPRSLAFQLIALAGHVMNLPRDAGSARDSPEHRLVASALGDVRLADLDALALPNEDGDRDRLDDLLGRLAGHFPALSDVLSHHYLTHVQAARQLSGPSFGEAI
ncbi:MAG TPA: circularly permuted type 2 ATP-grasp protein [Gemmataceae bacterium]|nr:circularly permuted type 2 ATP-grasp protein [Gemmataceae bacterium]